MILFTMRSEIGCQDPNGTTSTVSSLICGTVLSTVYSTMRSATRSLKTFSHDVRCVDGPDIFFARSELETVLFNRGDTTPDFSQRISWHVRPNRMKSVSARMGTKTVAAKASFCKDIFTRKSSAKTSPVGRELTWTCICHVASLHRANCRCLSRRVTIPQPAALESCENTQSHATSLDNTRSQARCVT